MTCSLLQNGIMKYTSVRALTLLHYDYEIELAHDCLRSYYHGDRRCRCFDSVFSLMHCIIFLLTILFFCLTLSVLIYLSILSSTIIYSINKTQTYLTWWGSDTSLLLDGQSWTSSIHKCCICVRLLLYLSLVLQTD